MGDFELEAFGVGGGSCSIELVGYTVVGKKAGFLFKIMSSMELAIFPRSLTTVLLGIRAKVPLNSVLLIRDMAVDKTPTSLVLGSFPILPGVSKELFLELHNSTDEFVAISSGEKIGELIFMTK